MEDAAADDEQEETQQIHLQLAHLSTLVSLLQAIKIGSKQVCANSSSEEVVGLLAMGNTPTSTCTLCVGLQRHHST